MKPTTQSRLEILRETLEKWRHMEGWNRDAVGMAVIQAVGDLDLWDDLAMEGITFKDAGDLTKNTATRAQKIYRWVGCYSEATAQPKKLFFVEQAIVAAMPDDLKIRYLNQVYSGARVCFGAQRSGGMTSTIQAIKSLSKESSEAERAMIDLLDGATAIELQAAEKELGEMMIATQNAITTVVELKAGVR